jgi:hypothetical protein
MNPGGDNVFIAEFATKGDMDRVLDGPPWVVGKNAVLLNDFNVDQKPDEMTFNKLKLWVRILNLPFGYMHKRSGSVIASSIGGQGSVPVVDCDATGRCWGSYMCVRVEIDINKPLQRGVTVFSQRRNMYDWFELRYENLPRYCFSCGLIGHSSTECLNPGDRDADGKLPYSADSCASDERKKKTNGAQSSSGSVPMSRGRSSSPTKDRPTQTAHGSGAADKHAAVDTEVSSPAKKRQTRTRTKAGTSNNNIAGQDGSLVAGQKRKKVLEYRVRNPTTLTAEAVHPLALVVRDGVSPPTVGEVQVNEVESNDSNKKRKGADLRSADQAGAVEQPRQTQ